MQNQEKSTSNTFTKIQDVILYDGNNLGLKINDRFIYMYLVDQCEAFARSEKVFYKSQPQIAKELKIDRKAVNKSITKLVECGLISTQYKNGKGTTLVYSVSDITKGNNEFDKQGYMRQFRKVKDNNVVKKEVVAVPIVGQKDAEQSGVRFVVPDSVDEQPEVINEINKNLTIEEVMTNERCLWSISQDEIRRVNYLSGATVGDALELYNNNETTSELDDLLLYKFLVSSGVGDSINNGARREIQEDMIPI